MKVFLSWSNDLTGFVAQQFEERLRLVLGGSVEPFLSRNMAPGTRPMDRILVELEESQHLLAFLTRDDLNPPWVIFEAGAVGKHSDKSNVTPITIGFSPGAIEPPLKIMRQGVSIDDEDGIRKVFTLICKAAKGDHTKLDQGFHTWFEKLQAELTKQLSFSLTGGGKDWALVRHAKLAEGTSGSPFEASDALRVARKHVVFTGQNLFSLVGRHRPISKSWFCEQSMAFLKCSRAADTPGTLSAGDRKLDLLMMDPTKPDLVSAWGRSIGDEPGFSQHLKDCVAALPEFKQIAKKKGVGDQVGIKLANFIPLSATFIDPDDKDNGALFLRPFTRGDTPKDRPVLLITRRDNPQAFKFYWERHDADFSGRLTTREL